MTTHKWEILISDLQYQLIYSKAKYLHTVRLLSRRFWFLKVFFSTQAILLKREVLSIKVNQIQHKV